MNYWAVLSVIATLIGGVLLWYAIFFNEGLGLIAAPVIMASAYLDHLAIEKSFRDFPS
ncbi:hypothetical protein [Pseudomonas sp. NMS19W]|uniref:hypothetical protein n=1 Tax=Pseudomonas sp. NMS19W TaxID=3079768 RepID=UPI003F65C979